MPGETKKPRKRVLAWVLKIFTILGIAENSRFAPRTGQLSNQILEGLIAFSEI
jgi:hypothetical protein